jgi:hypothetical protein
MQILMISVYKYDPQDDANERSMNKLHPSAKVSKHVLQSLVNYNLGCDFFNIMLVCKILSNVTTHTILIPLVCLQCF